MSKTKATKVRAKSYSISLPPDIYEKTLRAAFRKHQSFSQYVRDAVLNSLEAAR
jgi:predicted DNA-binding protein